MKCPICSIALQSIEKLGFEYDYCPKCLGIWLDRSEIDRIVEQAETERAQTSLQMTRQVAHGKDNYVLRKKSRSGVFVSELFNHM